MHFMDLLGFIWYWCFALILCYCRLVLGGDSDGDAHRKASMSEPRSGTEESQDSTLGALPKLLIIAFDGLRHDFITAERTPHIYNMAINGVWSPGGVRSQFPTTTTPNFYAMSTGLHTESSGIVGNVMYQMDPIYEKFDYWNFGNDSDVLKNSLKAKWYSGHPIYVANQQHGGGRRTGCMFWPTCDIEGSADVVTHARRWEDYGNLTTWTADAEELIGWFEDTEEPINFGLYYISQPDELQHGNDIYSNVVRELIKDLDTHMGNILDRAARSSVLKDKLNIILLADHGHVNVKIPETIIDVTEVIPRVEQKSMRFSGEWSLIPALKNITIDWDSVYDRLSNYQKKEGLRFKVYKKDEFQNGDYHYAHNPLVGPLIIMVEPGYIVLWNQTVEELSISKENSTVFGTHGYMQTDHRMNALFVAHGPAFRKGYRVPKVFDNIDLYPLMAHILGITVPASNGSFDAAKCILESSSGNGTSSAFAVAKMALSSFLNTGGPTTWVIIFAMIIPVGAFICYCFVTVITPRERPSPYSMLENGSTAFTPSFRGDGSRLTADGSDSGVINATGGRIGGHTHSHQRFQHSHPQTKQPLLVMDKGEESDEF